MKIVIEIEPERCTSITRFRQHMLKVIEQLGRPSAKQNVENVGYYDGEVHDTNGNRIGTWRFEE